MKIGYAEQYHKPCVILEKGDLAEDIIGFAEIEGAVFYDGPDPIEDKCYVVKFPNRPKELYTREALMRSFPIRD